MEEEVDRMDLYPGSLLNGEKVHFCANCQRDFQLLIEGNICYGCEDYLCRFCCSDGETCIDCDEYYCEHCLGDRIPVVEITDKLVPWVCEECKNDRQ